MNLLTWYEVETNTENNPCLIGKSWISSRDIFNKRFLICKLYTSHVTTCAYQELRNVSFFESNLCVRNK